jgi:EAL domain-containing protein (putative c-di-GMP-specific phosphodiesterase class I)
VRGADTVCRQGGDEFIILLSEVSNLMDAANKADRLLKALAETHSTAHHELHITGSIGISVYPDDGQDADTLIKNADTAMYQAKANGRQSCQFFTAAMNARAVERQVIEESLRRGLKGNEFELHYQPKINLRTRKITGAEALIRWNHPTRGMIPPSEFIPVAEDCGLIVAMGAWVLRTACQQAKAWCDAGLPKLVMSVNVSAAEFSDKNFLEGVLTALRETETAHNHLELELTESVLMKRPDAAVNTLRTLRNKGISIAIDDFGTGYSSLSYLRKFPVDALKIDQSFVRHIESDGEDTVIVKAIIGMARNLKLRVVAEGVETLAQMQFLAAHRCEEVQGYYFSKPLPAAQFAELLQDGVSSTFHSDNASDQRRHARHRVLKEGKIVTPDMQCVTDVKIRDLSVGGAMVILPANISLPKVFSLLIVSERLLYPAVARWRKSGSAGLEFVGKPHATAMRIDNSRQATGPQVSVS